MEKKQGNAMSTLELKIPPADVIWRTFINEARAKQ